MKIKRFLSCLLAALLTFSLVALSSCKDDTPDTQDSESDTESVETEAPETVLDLAVDGKSDYVIIIPEDCDDRIVSAVSNLVKAFKNYTGADVSFDFDLLIGTDEADPDAKEILVGDTNRPESAEAVEGLASSDYAVCVVGNKLVLNGGEGDVLSTVAAVQYFISSIIQKELTYGTTNGSLSFGSKQNYIKLTSATVYIESCTVLGTDIADCTIVYPDGGDAEEYVALLLGHHIKSYAKLDVKVASDAEPVEGVMLLIGKTKHSTLSAEAGKYNIEVTDKGFEAVADSMEGYADVYIRMQSEIFKYSQKNIALEKGQKWEGSTCTPENIAHDSDIRVMYHNVFSYSGYAASNRYKLASQVYETYMPDIIGFQETRTEAFADVEDALSALGYEKRVGTSYTGNPVWFNTSTLECLASGSVSGARGYDTVWCIFKVKSSGKVFGFTNSHFTADSMSTQAGVDRTTDARALLSAVNTILTHEKGGADITVISGGDLNTTAATTAYATLVENGDLANVRGLAEVCTELSCYHWGFDYIESAGLYALPVSNTTKENGNAIDHVFLGGNKLGVSVDEYAIISSSIPSVISDHSPHFVDISFSDAVYEPFGPSAELPFPEN